MIEYTLDQGEVVKTSQYRMTKADLREELQRVKNVKARLIEKHQLQMEAIQQDIDEIQAAITNLNI